MKLPSPATFARNAIIVFKRFPTLFILVVLATVLACFLLGRPAISTALENDLWSLLAACNLLLTLGLAADLFAESKAYPRARQWALRSGAMVCCALLYVVLDPIQYRTDVVRYGLFVFAFHQLVAFAPFIKRGGSRDFWHFNKALFLRMLTAVLYSASLYAGLAVALFGVEELFNLDLASEIYSQLFAVVAIGFNTLFFLAGVPTVFDVPSLAATYPKGLKIFTQYVLIPLLTIYLGILLVYEIKILIEWEMPKGIVATLILGYAVFGILSLLLVWPIKDEVGNRWVQLFSRFFYLAMLPLIVLLALAVYQRVSHYGFTEERYILLVLALWLSGITLYFLRSRKDGIRLIPMSLSALALMGTFGPQSATNISRNSQQVRLTKALNTANEMNDERPSIVTYLLEAHGLQSMQAFTQTNLDSLNKEITETHADLSSYSISTLKRDTIFAILDVPLGGMAEGRYLTISREGHGIIPIRGYDYGYKIEPYQIDTAAVPVGKHECRITVDRDSTLAVSVTMEDDTTIVFDLIPLIDEIYQANKDGQLKKTTTAGNRLLYPAERMQLLKENSHFTVVLLLEQLDGDFLSPHQESGRGLYLGGYLLFREK